MRNAAGLAKLHGLLPTIDHGSRQSVIDLVNSCEFAGAAAEIGTFIGTFAGELLDKTKISELACVDPYESYGEFRDAINGMDLDLVFSQAQSALARFGPRVRFVREYSANAAARFADLSLDFVYIDANHQTEFVARDLVAWWPKVRPGGLLIGDDCVDLDDALRNAAGDVTVVHTRKPDGTPDVFGEYGVFNAVRAFSAAQDLGHILFGIQFVIPK